jgi:hypothetical protein
MSTDPVLCTFAVIGFVFVAGMCLIGIITTLSRILP